jgi:hypothetical protein
VLEELSSVFDAAVESVVSSTATSVDDPLDTALLIANTPIIANAQYLFFL